jgi:hypothetical protein
VQIIYEYKILEVSKSYQCYVDIKENLHQGKLQQKFEGYELKEDRILMYRCIFYVPNDQELKKLLLSEMHKVPYVGHPVYRKIIAAVKKQHYWLGMKNKVIDFIARCLECKKVRDEHRHPAGLIQTLPILEWKWEAVTMDFITKLPWTAKQHDSIMVVVDKATKSVDFILVKSTHKETNIADIYMR